MIHEDDRRTLEDYPEAKVITTKTECVLGDHYHKVKTEKFVLISGFVDIILDGEKRIMIHDTFYTITPGQRHTFIMTEGSVMIGLCSHPYDPTDDYK